MTDQLTRRFTTQPLIGNMPERVDMLKGWALQFAVIIDQAAIDSREKSLALTALEETLMWAVKAVVLGDAVIEVEPTR